MVTFDPDSKVVDVRPGELVYVDVDDMGSIYSFTINIHIMGMYDCIDDYDVRSSKLYFSRESAKKAMESAVKAVRKEHGLSEIIGDSE